MIDAVVDYYGGSHALPGPHRTKAALKAANKAKGGHFFDRATMSSFGSRIESVVAGRIFITSEQDTSSFVPSGQTEPLRAWDGERRYTVRVMDDEGDVRDLCPPVAEDAEPDAKPDAFGAFASLDEAAAWVNQVLAGDADTVVADWAKARQS